MHFIRKNNIHTYISIKRLLLSLMLTAFSLLFFTGCGKEDPKLTEYKNAMSESTLLIQDIIADIDAIDVEDDNRTEYLLGYLDELDDAFSQMAAIPVPEQFESISELADEASANLSRAVSLYHQAFDGEAEGYDFSVVSAAQEYYSRAFLRLSYIGTILQGQVPDGENIEVIYDNGGDTAPVITDPAGQDPQDPIDGTPAEPAGEPSEELPGEPTDDASPEDAADEITES